MDKCSSDAEFDSYWEFEAKNKNRNRIRVGRQYQASIPPLLKPGEKDTRKCEDLETIKWTPEQISEQDIDSYLSMAKAVSSFARTIESNRGPEKLPENSLQTAIKGLTEFVTSHHPCHRDAGCKVPVSESSSSSMSVPSSSTDVLPSKPNVPSDWTPPEARLFAQALESCGKNFCAIKKEFLPWKPVRSLIEYYYHVICKGEKVESPKALAENSPESTVCKVEKTEPIANFSQDTEMENVDKVENSDTKDEKPPQEIVKIESELQATLIKEEEEKKPLEEEKELPLPQLGDQSSVDQEFNAAQSTVGCLKFFLGGRLVLKLNAQQEGGSSTTKCHWVQSHDTPKYSHQSKKMRHRKKSIQDVLPHVSSQSPKPKKKFEEESVNNQESSAVKKPKLKSSSETFPLLCSSSWTPPVADGQDAAEFDDASSKTSEGHDSPVIIANRAIKVEDIKRCEMTTDMHELKYERKTWPVAEFISGMPVDQQDYLSHCSNVTTSEKISPDALYSHDVINHKSALTPAKFQPKGSNTQSHAAHLSSPNVKPFNKWSNTTLDLSSSSERPKCLPCFHSPSSLSCHASPENSSRDFVLDLSSKSGSCKAQDPRISQEPCCSMYRNEPCTENCSSSEESAHNDNSMCCAKSSNIIAYCRESSVPPGVETCKSEPSSLASTSQNFECDDKNKTSDGLGECSGRCMCYYNPSTSCASPKCCKGYSSKEYVCNKEDCSGSSSPNSVMSLSASDVYSKNQQMWFGPSMPPLLQIYPQCYPYYVSYDMSQSVSSNPSPTETPLDLSSSEAGNKEDPVINNISELGMDVPKNATEAMDRGMLYQLLKNKANK